MQIHEFIIQNKPIKTFALTFNPIVARVEMLRRSGGDEYGRPKLSHSLSPFKHSNPIEDIYAWPGAALGAGLPQVTPSQPHPALWRPAACCYGDLVTEGQRRAPNLSAFLTKPHAY